MAKKKAATKKEREFMGRMADLGCVVCRNTYYTYSPANFHHCKFNRGFGQKKNHMVGFGLCPLHHQHGGNGIAFHSGRLSWENNFGKEEELFKLAMVRYKKSLTESSIML